MLDKLPEKYLILGSIITVYRLLRKPNTWVMCMKTCLCSLLLYTHIHYLCHVTSFNQWQCVRLPTKPTQTKAVCNVIG